MATTLELAENEIYARLLEDWTSGAQTIAGTAGVPELLYEILESSGRPETDRQDPFARITVQHTTGRQISLNGPGGSKFEHEGFLTVQVFAQHQNGKGATICQRLATLVQNAFEGKRTSEVWFRNVRFNNPGREGPWYQINVISEFRWESLS